MATATMTTSVDEIVDASSAIKTARRRKLSLGKTQVFHEHNTLGLSKNFAMTLLQVPESDVSPLILPRFHAQSSGL